MQNKMKLSDLKIKPLYQSYNDNLLEDFYSPVLGCAKIYKRASAYFDSNIISLYSTGIDAIVKNKGHIFFIFSADIPEKDFEDISNGYLKRKEIENMLCESIAVDDPDIRTQNLGYLIAHNYVDVKIAITSKGIFHDKIGIVNDGENTICFRGSNNETSAGVTANFESFETTCSWDASEREKQKIQGAEEEFKSLWDNNFSNTIVIDIPDVVRKKLISYNKSGRLVYLSKERKNAVTLFLNGDNMLCAINNLDNYRGYSEQSDFFKLKIKPYILKNDNKNILFKSSLSVMDFEAIITSSRLLGSHFNYNVCVDDDLEKYIDNQKINIEKYKSLGIGIKKGFEELYNPFNSFCSIVNSEVERKLLKPQLIASFHLAMMKKSANFSVPGSGKTAIVLGAFAYLSSKEINLVDKILMIGPLNSFKSWRDEFNLVFGKKRVLNSFMFRDFCNSSKLQKEDAILYEARNSNLIMINYEALITYKDVLRRIIDDRTLLVFDEVHRVKNVSGKRALSAISLTKNCNAIYRCVLTGTPIPNGYKDAYNFLHFLFYDNYNSYFPYDVTNLDICNTDKIKASVFNQALYPFFCITTKKDLGVPPADPDDFSTGYCEGDSEDEKLYRIVYKSCGHNILLLYIRLIEASCNPSLILNRIDPSLFDSFYDEDTDDSEDFKNEFDSLKQKESYDSSDKEFISSFGMTKKFYKGISIIEKEVKNGNHVIAWAIFIDTLMKIKKELEKHNIKCKVIDGSVPLELREQIIDEFRNNEFDVLIANPATLAESVSLHQTCHVAIYFEYSFNLVHMLQSKDRIHRLGLPQNQRTHFYFMIMNITNGLYNCIDLRILEKLKIKANREEEAVTNDKIDYVENDLISDINDILHGK